MEEHWRLVAEHGGEVIPVLVGPTGCGKTARVHAWAQDTGRELHTLLLGTQLAEDVLGLPKVRTEGRRTVTSWSLPTWAQAACDRPCVIFLDELDKARPEVQATVLTLIASREVRGHRLHPDTRIVGAMQPVDRSAWLADPTGEALSARAVFFPIGYDWEWLLRTEGVDLREEVSLVPEELPTLPYRTLRQVAWAAHFVRAHVPQPLSPEDAVKVLEGAFGANAERVVRAILETAPVSREAIVQAVVRDPSLVSAMSVPEVIDILPDLWDAPRADAVAEAWVKIWTEGTQDDCELALSRQYEHCRERAKGAPYLDVFLGSPDAEATATLHLAVQRIVVVLADRVIASGKTVSDEAREYLEKLRAVVAARMEGKGGRK